MVQVENISNKLGRIDKEVNGPNIHLRAASVFGLLHLGLHS